MLDVFFRIPFDRCFNNKMFSLEVLAPVYRGVPFLYFFR